MPRRRTPPDPFRWFDSSPEVIRYVVMLYVGVVRPTGGLQSNSGIRPRHGDRRRKEASINQCSWWVGGSSPAK